MAALCEFSSLLQPPGRESGLCAGRCVQYFASRHELSLPVLGASWSPAKPQRKLYSCLGEDVEPQPRSSAGLELGFGVVLTTATGPLHWCWHVPGQPGVQAGGAFVSLPGAM